MESLYLEKIWHPFSNLPLRFEDVQPQSSRLVEWLGHCGHGWAATMAAMTNIKNTPCPYCGNRKVLTGFNDLATLNPALASQWHPTKNAVLPENVLAISRSKYWWIDEFGHEWETALHLRSQLQTGCPYCSGKKVLEGFNDLATVNPEVARQWHPTKNGAHSPATISFGSSQKAWWLGECNHEWEAIISNRARKNKGSGCPYCAGQKIFKGLNDFQTLSPDKSLFWHPEKNKKSPTEVGINSTELVWWKEPCGHEYQMSPFARHKALKCQVCSNRIVIPNINDLTTTHPEIAVQWHPTKNGSVQATQVTAGQPKKFWWLGECGHEWKASVNDRVSYQTKCPYCTNQKVLPGYNDLTTTHPDIAIQWDYSKNILTPSQVVAGADIKAWWVCEKSHEWEAFLYSRTNIKSGTKCPVCSEKRVWPGENDLLTLKPEVAKEWHPTKNILKPEEVSCYSSTKVWWVCESGHEWEATVSGRSQGKGCRKCNSILQASQAERDITSYLRTLGLEVETNDRTILSKNREIDLYLPDQHIAVEFNGLYWHSEAAGKNKNYHYDKWNQCKKKGIQLIQIWEDDWNRNPELVKKMLSHKIGKSTSPKIYARKLSLSECTIEEAKEFLNKYHIQGWVSSSMYLGLKDADNKIQAILAFKKISKTNTSDYYLTRYATKDVIPGGFTKLLNYFEQTYKPDTIITFSDNTLSDGKLYFQNGFTEDKILPPDYYYFSGKKRAREHKFLYRLHRFKTDPNLVYAEGLTERQLAEINNLVRIWDAGKTRWVKICSLN